MENASKALIIAGAILISIVLITLGVVIIGQGQSVVNSSNMDDQQVSTWNQKFTQYEGSSVSGGNVNALINAVISNNVIAKRDGEEFHLIEITVGGADNGKFPSNQGGPTQETPIGTTKATKNFSPKAASGKLYTVKVTDYHASGYIKQIDITENT